MQADSDFTIVEQFGVNYKRSRYRRIVADVRTVQRSAYYEVLVWYKISNVAEEVFTSFSWSEDETEIS